MPSPVENHVAQYASVQAMAEIGLGSAVHALHIPLGGHVLSVNELICLSLATRQAPSRAVAARDALSIATIVSMLKILSPAGKRVMPMLAIFMQGLLFTVGLALFGANLVGALIGAILSSVWAFAQPLATAYVIFGTTFFQAVENTWNDLAKQLGVNPEAGIWIVAICVGVKAVVAIVATAIAWKSGPQFEDRYLARMDQLWFKARGKSKLPQTEELNEDFLSHARAAFFDLLNPLFLLSLILCVIFLRGEAWGFAARTIGLTYLLFLILRWIPKEWIEKKLENYPNLAATRTLIQESARVNKPQD